MLFIVKINFTMHFPSYLRGLWHIVVSLFVNQMAFFNTPLLSAYCIRFNKI